MSGPLPSYLFNVDYVDIMNRVEQRIRGRIRRGVMALFTDYATDSEFADLLAALRSGTLSTANLYRSFDVMIGDTDLLSEPIRSALDKAGLSVMRIASRDVGDAVERWAERTGNATTPSDVKFDLTDPGLIGDLRHSGDLFWGQMLKDSIRAIKDEIERSYYNGDSGAVMADRLEMVTGLTSDQAETLDRIRKTLASGPLKPADKAKALRANADRMRASRADRITRTELHRIVHAGASTYWQQMARRGLLDYNTTMVEWQTHPTEQACNVCAPLDGHRTYINGQFAPGIVSPPAHPHCRCSLELKYQVPLTVDLRKAFVPRDGDGDGKYSLPGGPDVIPMPRSVAVLDRPRARNAYDALKKSATLLDEDGRAATTVDRYTRMDFATTNETLRTFKGKRLFGFVNDMDRAFDTSAVELDRPETLYRGMVLGEDGVPAGQTLERVRTMFAVGSSFVDHAYMSTTFDDTVAHSFYTGYGVRVRFDLTAPEGTRVLAGLRSESELILNRGARLVVTSYEETEDDDGPLVVIGARVS